jgi:hypothetical protein
MRIPIPADSEKKACPNAGLQMNGSVSTDRSGVKKNAIPSENPDNVTEKAAILRRITDTSGMRTVVNRSIPSRTPRESTSCNDTERDSKGEHRSVRRGEATQRNVTSSYRGYQERENPARDDEIVTENKDDDSDDEPTEDPGSRPNVTERGDDVSACPPATVDFEDHERHREDEHSDNERNQIRTAAVSPDD